MEREEFVQAVRDAKQRQRFGQEVTDEDLRYLKMAEREGLNPDALQDGETGKEESWAGISSEVSKLPTKRTAAKKSAARQSPAPSTGSDSTSTTGDSADAPQGTTSGPATDADGKTADKADTAS